MARKRRALSSSGKRDATRDIISPIQARVSASLSSNGARSFTARASDARTEAERTSYFCAPAWAAPATAKAASATSHCSMRNGFLRDAHPRPRERGGLVERHARRLGIAPVLVLDHAFLQAALAHDD